MCVFYMTGHAQPKLLTSVSLLHLLFIFPSFSSFLYPLILPSSLPPFLPLYTSRIVLPSCPLNLTKAQFLLSFRPSFLPFSFPYSFSPSLDPLLFPSLIFLFFSFFPLLIPSSSLPSPLCLPLSLCAL